MTNLPTTEELDRLEESLREDGTIHPLFFKLIAAARQAREMRERLERLERHISPSRGTKSDRRKTSLSPAQLTARTR